jgi:hypothetical protein
MAKIQDTSQSKPSNFVKGLNKDSDPTYIQEGMWTHARNVVNNNIEGDIGSLSNQASNFKCPSDFPPGITMPQFLLPARKVVARYVIGAIHLFSDKWIIYTAGHNATGQPVMSEIGLLEEERCIYRPIVQDACLGFDKRYLISGSARLVQDCSWQVYWADGLNPDRYLNVGDPQTWPASNYTWGLNPFVPAPGSSGSSITPATYDGIVNYYVNEFGDQILWPGVQWVENCSEALDSDGDGEPDPSCVFCRQFNSLDCIHTRLARIIKTPCLRVRLGDSGGTLRNGTYFAILAYSVNGVKVSDYFSPSNSQPIWYDNDLQGSLVIEVEADAVNFDEFILVVVQNINQGTVAKQIGIYSTKTQRIELDQIKEDLISVPVRFLPVVTPIVEKSNQIGEVNDYLLRVGTTSKFDFNYQPLANLIQTRWTSVAYPADYYIKGGNKGSYMRDEVYAFFIRWVYDTGDKSASYHIPGRVERDYKINGINYPETIDWTDRNTLAASDRLFEVYNTASAFATHPLIGTTTDDGGTVIAVGDMGYWESEEKYPDNKPEVWNASANCWTAVPTDPVSGLPISDPSYDLCGQHIRHHKFPDNYLNANTLHFESNTNYTTFGSNLKIRIMGVFFENIIYPKDNYGEDIPGIVGYEILRGSREGNKSVVAKGMINNFRSYEIKGNAKRNRTGLYANYPFNTIKPISNTNNLADLNYNLNDPYIKAGSPQNIPREIVSFHSPDTMFRTPFLSFTELKLYGHLLGVSDQQFKEPDRHPKWKLLSNETKTIMYILGIAEAVYSFQGKYIINEPPPQPATTNAGSIAGGPVYNAAVTAYNTAAGLYTTQLGGYFNGLGTPPFFPLVPPAGLLIDTISTIFTGVRPVFSGIQGVWDGATATAASAGLITTNAPEYQREMPKSAYMDPYSRLVGGLNQFIFYFSEGVDIALRGVYACVKWDQYALQMIAHGFYGAFGANKSTDTVRFRIEDSTYLRDNTLELPRYQITLPVIGTTTRNYSINNLKRSDTVVLRTDCGVQQNNQNKGPSFIQDASGNYIDQSLQTLGTIVHGPFPAVPSNTNLPDYKDYTLPFSTRIASHYASVKVRLGNQYGQLQSTYQGIKQIVITPCEQKIGTGSNIFNSHVTSGICYDEQVTQRKLTTTPVLFGGDIFINRYTEKNSMFFFYDWLYGQPDGFEYNYAIRNMIPYARFYANSERFDSSDLLGFSGSGVTAVPTATGTSPEDFYYLDNPFYSLSNGIIPPTPFGLIQGPPGYPGKFRPKDSFFYLANSSVRDFFVESEVLVDFRIDGDYEWEKSYNPYKYTDLVSMFNMDPQIITRGNEYRYDYSLSISKLFTNYFSYGTLQSRYYDPKVASLCYTYNPNRIIYSLQQSDTSYRGDNWIIFLANNYKDFISEVSGIKQVNKSGLFITFKNDSPLMFQGIDQLQTELGTKLTIGDGGLFSQPGQSVTNADRTYEYGSSQNRLSVISSPAGIYYISQNQGKIFSYGDGIKEISQNGLKWWFNNFLPYKLTVDFPDYPWNDNPVAGIGCQTLYDNENSVLYFTKKDYKLRDIFKGRVEYIPLNNEPKRPAPFGTLYRRQGDFFLLDGQAKYLLGDPFLFEDASWTVSFDPKNNFFISFHDWHPDLTLPTKVNYLTTKTVRETFNGTQQLMANIWKHDTNPGGTCGTYCNFYGVDYPFEIEIPVSTGQTVTTIKSVEYILECYKRSEYNCFDQYHVLDFNFDRALVYNSEQVSGYLNLNIFPKNNVALSLQYPRPNPSLSVDPTYLPVPGYDILFSKEENKYRLNQFWDITKDRAEFPIGSSYPPQGPLIPGTTQLLGNYDERQIWETGPSGYKRLLNQANLDYVKPLLQRKKFRHYLNFLSLSRMVSGDVNMIFKISNIKNQVSLR